MGGVLGRTSDLVKKPAVSRRARCAGGSGTVHFLSCAVRSVGCCLQNLTGIQSHNMSCFALLNVMGKIFGEGVSVF